MSRGFMRLCSSALNFNTITITIFEKYDALCIMKRLFIQNTVRMNAEHQKQTKEQTMLITILT